MRNKSLFGFLMLSMLLAVGGENETGGGNQDAEETVGQGPETVADAKAEETSASEEETVDQGTTGE